MNAAQTRFTTEGLVIKEMNVGESDRLVTLFTQEYGLIKAFAAGAKNIKSKKGAATSLLTYSSFTILNKKGTLRIYEATPKAQFFTMGSDLEVLSLSQYFCELLLTFGESENPNKELLRLMLNSLHFLTKEKRNPDFIKAVTEFRTAVISGYMPNLVACSECSKFEDDMMFFDLTSGQLFCSECEHTANSVPLNPTLLSALRHIAFSEFKKLYSFDIPDMDAKRLSEITSNYIIQQTEQHFSALEFYQTLN